MVANRLEQIQSRIRDADGIPEDKRRELMALLTKLRGEIESLESAQADHAESITGFTERSTHEVVRDERDPDLVDLSIQGLGQSVRGMEATHPKLVETVNAICNMLSGIGV